MRRLALAVFALHLVANPHYGFFRDELYFIVCGRHPALGYVDQPPLVPLLAAASQLFGTSLFALRAVAALFAAASVYVTLLLTRELGGGWYAQALAGIATALCPILAVFGVIVGPDDVTIAAWPLLAYLVLRLVKGGPPRLWLWTGLVTGLALQAKYSAVFYVAALVVGLLASEHRRLLATRWFFAAVALALVIALPNVLWQASHGYPMLELLQAGQRGKNVILGPAEFLLQQLLITNPLLAVLWLIGLFAARERWLQVTSAFAIGIVLLLHGKDYYACGAYPALFALGAVVVERWTRSPLVPALAAAAGLLTLPMAAPVLPEAAFVAYADALYLKPKPSEHHAQAALPQLYADMHGWPELARAVERAAALLTPEERARAVIKTPNYGEASAIAIFGSGLPPVVSGHNQYFLWGPQGRTGDVLIDVDGDCGAKWHAFRSVQDAGVFTAGWVMPYEDQMPIRICRGIQKPLAEVWHMFKNYN